MTATREPAAVLRGDLSPPLMEAVTDTSGRAPHGPFPPDPGAGGRAGELGEIWRGGTARNSTPSSDCGAASSGGRFQWDFEEVRGGFWQEMPRPELSITGINRCNSISCTQPPEEHLGLSGAAPSAAAFPREGSVPSGARLDFLLCLFYSGSWLKLERAGV